MPVSLKKYLPFLVLTLFSVPLFFMNIHDGHEIGDDFAQYIREAMNIAHGRPFYESNYIFNRYNTAYAPPQYPPGFPLLLSPVVAVWGMSIPAMLYFNSLLAAGLLFTLFAYFRKHTGVVAAVCLAVLITYNSFPIYLKGNVLSDMPCLLMVMIYFLLRNAERFTWRRILILVVASAMAILIRPQAILILGAEVCYVIVSIIRSGMKAKALKISSLSRSSLFIVFGSVILVLFFNKVVFYIPVQTYSFNVNYMRTAQDKSFIDILGSESGALLAVFGKYFWYSTDNDFLKTCIVFIQSSATVGIVVGFLVAIRKRNAVDDWFFALVCLLFIYFPVKDQRYFLNALPFMFYYVYLALRQIIPAVTSLHPRIVAVIITGLYLGLGFGHLSYAAKYPDKNLFPTENDKKAIQYLTEHVGYKEIIVFAKPRLLTLYTGKQCMNAAPEISLVRNKAIFDSLSVKYVLIKVGVDDGFFHELLNDALRPLDSTDISPGYELYRLR